MSSIIWYGNFNIKSKKWYDSFMTNQVVDRIQVEWGNYLMDGYQSMSLVLNSCDFIHT